ncbi:MAG: hypothetical protein JO169_08180, partial [Solirubrobacterales bacterium]|nr:hypothetical protein [Solirubrobacterales bacterium]
QIERSMDGRRRVTEVAVVASRRGEPFRLQTAVRFEAGATAPGEPISGCYHHYALPERTIEQLALARIDVPPAFARAATAAPAREAL